jgi:Adenylate and Guanylate cyclase catalytic domain
VETVGDCYVAVTGLPEPRKDHAVLMCRFAYECLQVMNDLTKKLEVTLGPDTGDLSYVEVASILGSSHIRLCDINKLSFLRFIQDSNWPAQRSSNGRCLTRGTVKVPVVWR